MAKLVSLIAKVGAVIFAMVCFILYGAGKLKVTVGEIAAITGVIVGAFSDISVNTAIDKFRKKQTQPESGSLNREEASSGLNYDKGDDVPSAMSETEAAR